MSKTPPSFSDWETVIGLEIHVQLNTKTKLFSSSRNRFGQEPNIDINEVDLGHPGSLPTLNREALHKALRFGIAIDSQISLFSTFDRKSYFYPDNPKNFQITQFYRPLIKGGALPCYTEGRVIRFPIYQAHLEEDTATLKHFPTFTGIDYNRAGVALMEIVSEPAFRSAKEAILYATELRHLLRHLDVAECEMAEGGMRMDVNISVRTREEALESPATMRPKVEIKNMNSFYNMALAIESECIRQIESYQRNPNLPHEEAIRAGTYRFDVATNKTVLMRRKEKQVDYRYVHEPDLPPLRFSQDDLNKIKASLPKLSHEKWNLYLHEYNLSSEHASLLMEDRFIGIFFQEALKHVTNPVLLANFLFTEFGGKLKECNKTLQESKLTPTSVGHLVSLIESGKLTGKLAKSLAEHMLREPEVDSLVLFKQNPMYQSISDTTLLTSIIEEVLAANPESIADFRKGKTKALAFLVGQVMKRTEGKASPDIVNALILDLLRN